MSYRFADHVAVVTGGSTGIGLSIAKGLLAEGARRVYITGRTAKTLDQAVAELGERAVAVRSDVSNLSDLNELKDEIEGRRDRLNAVFANAGIAEFNDFGATDEGEFAKTFDINVKGVFFTVQTLLPLMLDGAAVVLTGSIVGNKGMENLSLYNASKAAVRSFACSWANDLKARKIRVNSISPGITLTPIMVNGLQMDDTQLANFVDYMVGTIPSGRVAQPDDIAAVALFPASSDARYVNGVELAADGGMAQI